VAVLFEAVLAGAFIAGGGWGLYLRAKRPDIYQSLTS
jgi:hypothetical protein